MQQYVAVLFVDTKGLVLLQQKTNDAPRWPGLWCMFGGHVEAGESSLSAAMREMQEELEIELPPSAYTLVGEFDFPIGRITTFTASIPKDEAFPLHEGRGMGYFSKDEIERLAMFPYDKEIVRSFFATRVDRQTDSG